MSHILAIIKKELQIYFNSPIAYIFLVSFLLVSTLLYFLSFFMENQATMSGFFELLPIVLTFFVPAITMRLWAEERRQGTIELLFTLPLKDYEAVLGKYLASLFFLLLAFVGTLPIVIVVALLGDPDLGTIFTSYVGAFLLAAAYLAIGQMISVYTKNQIVAWILTAAVTLILLIIGFPSILQFVPKFLVPLLEFLGLGQHYSGFVRGMIDSRDFFYYISVISLFLFLNVRKLESRKY